jgi:hypothetical protein
MAFTTVDLPCATWPMVPTIVVFFGVHEGSREDGVRGRRRSRRVAPPSFVHSTQTPPEPQWANSQGGRVREKARHASEMNPRVAAIEARVATGDARRVARGNASRATRRHTHRC